MKNFINIRDILTKDLKKIISDAKKRKSKRKKLNYLEPDRDIPLKGKFLIQMFEKSSTRTRLSFYLAIRQLGGGALNLRKDELHFGEGGESIHDTAKILSNYGDIFMLRTDSDKKLEEFKKYINIPIINGLSPSSHPTQILSDIFTIEEILGSIDKQKITWVGDINNVLISLLQASHIFRFRLKIASPKALLLKNRSLINKFKSKNISFCSDPIEAVKGTDCVMTDVWVSMGEKKSVKKKKIFKNFQVNENLMRHTHKKTIFMHCLPAHRNEEVVDSVIDSKKSVVWQQAQNRMYVQQSILNYCIL